MKACEICFKRAPVRDGVCAVCHGAVAPLPVLAWEDTPVAKLKARKKAKEAS